MSENLLCAYKIMWLFVMFDLPTDTRAERKEASSFRKGLLDIGFKMSQYSVYTKHCFSGEKAESVSNKVVRILPSGGVVEILTVTDKQYSNIKQFHGKSKVKNSKKTQNLWLF